MPFLHIFADHFFSLFFFSFLGLFIGSFLGVVIDRLPEGESIIFGRSRCDYCKRTLRWFELIPLLSFFFQRGRCLRCDRRLSLRYPFIEIVSAIMFAYVWIFVDFSLYLYVPAVIVASCFLAIVFIDLRHMIIPDSLLIISMIATAVFHLFRLQSITHFFLNHAITGASAFIAFYLLWIFTKKSGVGFGDVKLAFALGLLLGFPRVIVGMYIAFLTGAFVGSILLLSGRKTMKSPIPFGPFLIFGSMMAMSINIESLFSMLLYP